MFRGTTTKSLYRYRYYDRLLVYKTKSTAFSYYYSTGKTLDPISNFPSRHIGPGANDLVEMCNTVGVKDIDDLVSKALPSSILLEKATNLGPAVEETEALERLKQIASENVVKKSYIGMGYNNTITPTVIQRNILESPSWYTQYTPYQPEISQGRLESLLNFQTMICDLTKLPIANASLLDEGTAAAEAMLLSFAAHNKRRHLFLVDAACHPQTIECVKTRAQGFGIKVEVVQDLEAFDYKKHHAVMGVLVQYPTTDGRVVDYQRLADRVHEHDALLVCAADIMSLAVLKPPGEFGADIAVGNTQRFGVPLGYGGPHAAYFAVRDEHKRKMAGRLIGVSKDAEGKRAYRLSLQTREQHIRREKATSNICTAQALLANMAAMYAVYHGADGVRQIATRIYNMTKVLVSGLTSLGYKVKNDTFFDTVTVSLPFAASIVLSEAETAGINLRHMDNSTVGISLDETVNKEDVVDLLHVFAKCRDNVSYTSTSRQDLRSEIPPVAELLSNAPEGIPKELSRTSEFFTHPVFNSYHSETEMLRYIVDLQNKDLSLCNAMIPLGSCTMKLNATTEMVPVSWPEFSAIHPFAPAHQTRGYLRLFRELTYALLQATGFDDMSLQPNSGAQGEYTGLRVIKAYLESIGETERDVCLIPVSAHGTNPASATLSGMKVVTVKCLPNGNLDLEDMEEKAKKHGSKLAATMITYPSTYGVFESGVKRACEIVHEHGGQVYMDGANLNAQLGLCNPAEIGADVCHLNLHKTFCIPHGGGGPGMGPIGVKKHLAPFLPSHPVINMGGSKAIGPVSAAPWGSASILPITWAYLKMMGDEGLKKATQVALLNANYLKSKLEPHYKILFTNENGMCAHEFIIDIRPFNAIGVEAIDVAKRLHDYSFHSPTMSFPVAGTLMVEPTESESLQELDRFVEAMVSIRKEIKDIEDGKVPKHDNPLINSPHPVDVLLSEKWSRSYTREVAAYPVSSLRRRKFWPTLARVDDTFGDRNLICSCPPIEDYE